VVIIREGSLEKGRPLKLRIARIIRQQSEKLPQQINHRVQRAVLKMSERHMRPVSNVTNVSMKFKTMSLLAVTQS
jgi:hypothetical protein